MKTIVIVGGGIAGIYAAQVALRKNYNVTLIEENNNLGGLLRSIKYNSGDIFDYGTHFIAGTGIKDIDDIILNSKFKKNWNILPNEHGGNYFADNLSSDCIFVNSNCLKKEIYYKSISDFIDNVHCDDNFSFSNLHDQLMNNYGEGFVTNVFLPILTKLFGTSELKQLIPDAHLRFGLKRLIISNNKSSRILKSIANIDKRIAFHTYDEGKSARPQYYPISGGAQEWVDALSNDIKVRGCRILTGTKVVNINRNNDLSVQSILLDNGNLIPCHNLIWTAPLFPLLNILKLKVDVNPPEIRRTILLNYVFDKAPLTNCHFFFCYDPHYHPFRVTLYSNIQNNLNSTRHRVGVEVITGKDIDTTQFLLETEIHLKKMGIIPEKAKILFKDHVDLRNGFPVLDHDYSKAVNTISSVIKSELPNTILAGRSSTKSWFMVDVFKDVFEKMNRL
jgi:protoporphyrinogen oxidase